MNTTARKPTASAAALCVLAALVAPTAAAGQDAMRFPEATESVPELIELYTQSDSACRLSRSRDVKVAVACLSRAVYGAALNERNWCFGKQEEANADMAWHACQAGSLRFPPLELPEL